MKVINYFITSDNESIFYRLHNSDLAKDKPLIVLNYGLVCSMYHFSFQLPFLLENNFRVLEYDYRAHFQSTGKDNLESVNYTRMTQDLKELLEYLNEDKVILVGHSMGVNIALEATKYLSQKIKGLVLISGTIFPVTNIMFDTNLMEFLLPLIQKLNNKYPKLLGSIWKSTGANPLIRTLIHHQGFNVKNVSKEFIEIYLNRVGTLGPDLFFKLFNEMITQNITSQTSDIKCPTLVMGGVKDRVIPNYLQRILAKQIKQSEEYYYLNGSHVPQVDFPEWTNQRLKIFFEKHF